MWEEKPQKENMQHTNIRRKPNLQCNDDDEHNNRHNSLVWARRCTNTHLMRLHSKWHDEKTDRPSSKDNQNYAASLPLSPPPWQIPSARQLLKFTSKWNARTCLFRLALFLWDLVSWIVVIAFSKMSLFFSASRQDQQQQQPLLPNQPSFVTLFGISPTHKAFERKDAAKTTEKKRFK